MKKSIFTLIICGLAGGGLLFASENAPQGAVVDFTACLTQSKYGKKEQENFESLRKQITSVMQETEKQIKEISEKLEDPDYVDTLSPKAEEEMTLKRDSLLQDMNRYQNELYQTLSQAHYIIQQKLHANVSKAAEKIAKNQKYPFVISKDSCFYYTPDMEITDNVLDEMDKNFDLENVADAQEPSESNE